MMVSKSPKFLILLLVLALAGAVVVAGCGGSGGTTTTASSGTEETAKEAEEVEAEEEPPAKEEPAEEETEEAPEEKEAEEAPAEEEAGGEEEGGGESAALAEGKTVFTTNCASCHTLKEAGTTGTVGPNLDELEPSESTVENQVINGGGPMPAFGKDNILSSKEVKAVATYVSSVAGTE
jgi:mono/diheme cytochrome c family protein